MWPLCTANNALWLLLPLLLGLLTGWWAWSRRSSGADLAYAAPTPEPVAVAAPRPVAVEPVAVAPAAAAPLAAAAATVAAVKVATPKAAPAKAPTAKAAPKKAAAPKVAKPVAVAAAMTAIGIPAAVGKPDDLLQIKGVGPKLNQLLIGLGIRRFDQIAKWGSAEIAKVDGHLGSFKGRIVRDNWVDQSGLLARGAIAEFEAKYGKLDSENQ
jgi:predicted flap endonuclease-1-like 5' DNA nuclease